MRRIDLDQTFCRTLLKVCFVFGFPAGGGIVPRRGGGEGLNLARVHRSGTTFVVGVLVKNGLCPCGNVVCLLCIMPVVCGHLRGVATILRGIKGKCLAFYGRLSRMRAWQGLCVAVLKTPWIAFGNP